MSQEDEGRDEAGEEKDEKKAEDEGQGRAAAEGKDGGEQKFDREYVEQLRKEAAGYRTKLKEIEDKDKSEQQKLTEKAQEAERRAQEAEKRAIRLKVGQQKGLPPELAERLKGDDEKSIAEDADQLAKTIGKDSRTSFDGGSRGGGDQKKSMDDLIRQAAGHQ